MEYNEVYSDGSAQDCSNSIALAMELLQSCANPSSKSVGQFSTMKSVKLCAKYAAETYILALYKPVTR